MGSRTLSGRKRYCKDGFFSGDGSYSQGAVVGFRNLTGDGKTQAGPVFLISNERVKDRIDPVFGYAASGIPAGDGDPSRSAEADRKMVPVPAVASFAF